MRLYHNTPDRFQTIHIISNTTVVEHVVPETHRAHSEFVFVRAIATTPHKLYNSKRQVKRQAIKTQPKISASLAKISARCLAITQNLSKYRPTNANVPCDIIDIANLGRDLLKLSKKISASLAKISAKRSTSWQQISASLANKSANLSAKRPNPWQK